MQGMDEHFLKAMGLWPLWIPRDTPEPAQVQPIAAPISTTDSPIAIAAADHEVTAPVKQLTTSVAAVGKPTMSATAKAGLAAALAAARGSSKPSSAAPASVATEAPVVATPGVTVVAEEAPHHHPEPMPMASSAIADNWEQLHAEIHACRACGLCESRTQAVPGVGNQQADWLFVGEAPGAEEDRQGEPFVGQAGKLLDNMLAAIGISRGNQVYIANVLKCRPPQNRDPQPQEVAACQHFLKRQIQLIQPKQIVALGRFAANSLLGQEATLSSLRGRVHQLDGIPLVVTYHPAYLLRNLPDKAKAWEDLCLAKSTLDQQG